MSDDEMSDSFNTDGDIGRGSPATHHEPIPQVRTARTEAPCPSQESTCQPSSRGTDILDKLSRTLDPEVQSRREADRASSTFQTQHLILLQSQIRDLDTSVLSLRSQLDDSERRCINADRRADCLQNQIDITSAVKQARLHRPTTRIPRRASPISISSSSEPALDGGRSTCISKTVASL